MSKDEAGLRVKERDLGLHMHSAEEFGIALLKGATDGKISFSTLKRLIRKYKLGEAGMIKCCSALCSNGVYDAKKIASLGVLLGSGDNAAKGRLLCKYLVNGCKTHLNSADIHDLLSGIVFLSVDVLGLLGQPEAENYLNKLKENSAGVVSQVVLDILQGSQTSSNLELNYALTHHFFEWLSSTSVRQLCSRPCKILMTALIKGQNVSLKPTTNETLE